MNTSDKETNHHRNCFFMPLLLGGFIGMSGVVMLLWNWLMPSIFNLPTLTYWQAMGLFVLCRILFGGLKFHRQHPGRQHAHQLHNAFKNKFMEMNEDEKLQFKKQWKNRCCK